MITPSLFRQAILMFCGFVFGNELRRLKKVEEVEALIFFLGPMT
jgi:hypothetical protein